MSRAQAPPTDEELSAKYAGVDAFEELQNTVAGLQQEQERLIGTAAHLSHELEVNKEHVKVRRHVATGPIPNAFVVCVCVCASDIVYKY